VIVVDTSALVAIVLAEPGFEACRDILEAEPELLISAGTVAEALIVAGRRDRGYEMMALIEGLGFTIVPVSRTDALMIADAYAQWGKGVHPAGLNFGDCFAYALAKAHACPLLYVGADFSRTDLPASG
jgi:ribonuclease VapC